ncbi:MAG: AAA family ATPase, partial [Muribaculaceae bacterium]|nr:AAA family ATPase [Muribaculaceae bacterium]
QNNIRNALHRHLPDNFSGFNLHEVMGEPSFFSEMLGLQGRMDFLQLDLRIIAEQKSGKGDWPYDNFISPRPRSPHYVQLLLYMLIIRYNYRERYEINNRSLNAFLLYSKYEKSLLSLGFAPRLVEEAIKMRNLIASRDIEYAENGMAYLAELTPEMLNTRKPDILWEKFTRPSLHRLLSPIRAAEDADRKYYLRFMRFIAKEHLLAKTGNRRKENSGFASTWLSPLEEKIESGNIYTSLSLDLPFLEEGKIEDVRLLFNEDERNAMANFRPGDVVILYSYPEGSEPDARKNMVFRSTIAEITYSSITLRLRSPQSSPKVFLNRLLPSDAPLLWAIEHDFMESSFSGLYRAMHSFLSAPSSRRDLLMLRREPSADSSLSLNLDHGGFNELALRAKQARDFFLIVGPPGTGKTSFGLMTSLREELTEPEANVVILAFTNRAVDEICSKLKAEGIDYLRLGTELSCTSAKENLLSSRIAECRSAEELSRMIIGTRVIVSTTTALNATPLLFKLKSFSLAIIDEASQILEPHIIGLLSAKSSGGLPAIRRFIMIGDHKQLPAVVQQREEDSRVTIPELIDIGLTDCSRSLFERLIKRFGNRPEVCYTLTTQGRMHEEIADFPNRVFYNGKLRAVPLPHQVEILNQEAASGTTLRDILLSKRVAFLDVISDRNGMSDKVNSREARLIAQIVAEIYSLSPDKFNPDRTVGVIVPYRNQISAIRNELASFGIEALTSITIDTIERFQGSQRKYIIFGFTVSRRYQIGFLTNQTFTEGESVIDRKLNVAMTRAEEHLLLVGNAPLLRSDFTFARLLDYLEERKAVFKF